MKFNPGWTSLLLLTLLAALMPGPVLARQETDSLQFAPSPSRAGLEDIVSSVSADNIVKILTRLGSNSRCVNSPTHAEAASFIAAEIKAAGLTPIIQTFAASGSGLRVPSLQNLVVRIPGTNPGAVHLLTAHFDSSPVRLFPPVCDATAPGANDNGSGVAVLLELARILGQGRARFSDDLELVFFDGEEFGYLGSSYFVSNFDSSRQINPGGLPLGAVINLDMVGFNPGGGKVWAVAQPGASLELAQQGTGVVARYWPSILYNVYTIGDLFPAGRDPNRLSDQQTFWSLHRGTAIFLTEDVADSAGADPRYHTPGDFLYNPDGSLRLDPVLMANFARAAAAIIGEKAGPQPSRFFPALKQIQFEQNWSRADRPVLVGSESGFPAGRSWLWGPAPFTTVEEPYEDSPGGSRLVTYFDKARMEWRQPGGFITNGLLVKEMATGALQLGDSRFVSREPSRVPVAGDPDTEGQNPDAPSYASFKAFVEAGGTTSAVGNPVEASLDKNSLMVRRISLDRPVRYAAFIPNTGHNIPDVFWNWFQSEGRIYNPPTDTYSSGKIFDWTGTVGFPISEAYWVRTKIGGKEQEVLVQLFERRVLTYNPANDAAFKVEMGNTGSHYYSWRYNS